eukprot:m.294115 g.294115  ORF g.294115 m.294115 type:complete len:61 (-) comp38417_c0_seq1:71-253(-)
MRSSASLIAGFRHHQGYIDKSDTLNIFVRCLTVPHSTFILFTKSHQVVYEHLFQHHLFDV